MLCIYLQDLLINAADVLKLIRCWLFWGLDWEIIDCCPVVMLKNFVVNFLGWFAESCILLYKGYFLPSVKMDM